jgi:hypothetical protein
LHLDERIEQVTKEIESGQSYTFAKPAGRR